MIRFECDYNNGCYEGILRLLEKTNDDKTPGYGTDEYCKRAGDIIREVCDKKDADVHFLSGGTQANTIIITSILKPYQGVISAESGHINAHETGAIEARGHKVLTLPSDNGKITADQIEEYCKNHYEDESFEHIVQPGMVYISNPTEIGTIYYKDEIKAIKRVCEKYNMAFFMDGARLGYGLTAEGADLTLKKIAKYCDVFYIGGTKQGALFGEAVVITNDKYKDCFRYCIKQHGGMFAKGRLLGIQFLGLFEDNAYLRLAKEANEYAYKIRDAFKNKGIEFMIDSPTNQQFPIIPNDMLNKLKDKYTYAKWWERDGKTAVRFCTSWATTKEDVKVLINDINEL